MKYFNLIFEALPCNCNPYQITTIVTGSYLVGILYVGSLCNSYKNFAFHLGDIMYFSRIFTWFLRHTTAILTKALVICESCDKFAPKNKF